MTAQSLPDSAYRITSHEILALLSFVPGPGTDLARTVLGLEQLPDNHDLVRAGVGTLNVRDAATVDGDEVSLLGAAKFLAGVFSSATLWFDVTRIGPDSVAPAYIAESPAGRVALFLRPMSEYVCLPLSSDSSVLDMLEATIEDALLAARTPEGGIVSTRRYQPGRDPKIANIKVTADGSLHLAAEPLDADGQLTVRKLEAGEMPASAVRQILAGTS